MKTKLKQYLIIIGLILLSWVGVYVFTSIHYKDIVDSQEVTIDTYQEGMTQYQKRISDSLTVWVSERRVMKMEISDLVNSRDSLQKVSLKLLKDLGIKESKIQSLSIFAATIEKEFKIKLEESLLDSMEVLRGIYEDLYFNTEIVFNPEDSTVTASTSATIPIIQAVVKEKYRYKEGKWFIGRLWKRIWEKPSLKQVLTSSVPDIKFKYNEYILITE